MSIPAKPAPASYDQRVRHFVDSAAPPTAAAMALARRAGVSAWAGYLDSEYDTRSWTPDQLTRTLAGVGALLPIYVAPFPASALPHANPVTDAQRALRSLASIRGHSTSKAPIVLDVEASIYAADPAATIRYVADFVHTIADRAYVVPYSSPAGLIGLGQHIPIVYAWAASWLDRPPAHWPADVTPPGLGDAYAGHRAWQFRGGTRAFGMTVDFDIADTAFPFMWHYSNAAPTTPPKTADATVVVDGVTYRGHLTA